MAISVSGASDGLWKILGRGKPSMPRQPLGSVTKSTLPRKFSVSEVSEVSGFPSPSYAYFRYACLLYAYTPR